MLAVIVLLTALTAGSGQAATNSHLVCEIKKLCALQAPKGSGYGHDRLYKARGRSRGGVLLVHGGAFYLTLPQAWPSGGPHTAFTQRGLDALVVDYPVSSVPAELQYVIKAERRLAAYEHARGLPVYAYGESSGGDLVGLLAVHRQIAAAAVNAPEGNLLTWPVSRPGFIQLPDFWQIKVPLSLAQRREFSPTLQVHGPSAPLLVEASRADTITPFSQGAGLARAAHGTLVVLKGDHLADPTGPTRAAQWLASKGWLVRKR